MSEEIRSIWVAWKVLPVGMGEVVCLKHSFEAALEHIEVNAPEHVLWHIACIQEGLPVPSDGRITHVYGWRSELERIRTERTEEFRTLRKVPRFSVYPVEPMTCFSDGYGGMHAYDRDYMGQDEHVAVIQQASEQLGLTMRVFQHVHSRMTIGIERGSCRKLDPNCCRKLDALILALLDPESLKRVLDRGDLLIG